MCHSQCSSCAALLCPRAACILQPTRAPAATAAAAARRCPLHFHRARTPPSASSSEGICPVMLYMSAISGGAVTGLAGMPHAGGALIRRYAWAGGTAELAIRGRARPPSSSSELQPLQPVYQFRGSPRPSEACLSRSHVALPAPRLRSAGARPDRAREFKRPRTAWQNAAALPARGTAQARTAAAADTLPPLAPCARSPPPPPRRRCRRPARNSLKNTGGQPLLASERRALSACCACVGRPRPPVPTRPTCPAQRDRRLYRRGAVGVPHQPDHADAGVVHRRLPRHHPPGALAGWWAAGWRAGPGWAGGVWQACGQGGKRLGGGAAKRRRSSLPPLSARSPTLSVLDPTPISTTRPPLSRCPWAASRPRASLMERPS